ncbi:MAG: hypothetical protein K2W81_02410 [Sphingomonas sp.]|uniref:hypothetical protein n=1 Tax=Sphingomonas sp. TaxID=28214 RepID=UPI0025FF460A|nr:hypothetical protein [Sphingomonas sp.]MBY0282801.1 hypothetical protein [Sphingomonas sp.]
MPADGADCPSRTPSHGLISVWIGISLPFALAASNGRNCQEETFAHSHARCLADGKT